MAVVRQHAAEALAVTQGWVASTVDPSVPSPAVAPLLAAAVGGSAPVPTPVAALAERGRGLIDEVAIRFSAPGDDPEEARVAAGLFVGSLALACAGLVGLVTVAAPQPVVHLQRLAAVVNLVDVPVATGNADSTTTSSPPAASSTTAPPETPSTSEPTTAPPSPAAIPPAAPVTSTVAVVGAESVPPATRGGLPIGKGMWIWMDDRAEGGDAEAIVARAKATGLTHLYVRTGTLKGGFIGGPFLDRLLPVAHANGIRVYGWDFPYLDRPGDDVNRALAAIQHTTPDGHRIDGFASDIETTHEGTNNDPEYVTAYCTWLRQNVGAAYPLIAVVPNPTAHRLKQGFPYQAILPSFDAVAPMVYWQNRDPATDVANAVAYLSQFGKPVFPIGQAYDGAAEGGPQGVPNREAIIRFLQFADGAGGTGASFWSWQHATPEVWDAVRDAAEFRLETSGPNGEGLSPGMIRSYQVELTALGFPVAADGVWGPAMADAVKAYQAAAKLPVTGRIDEATRAFLLTPVAAPIVHD
jgi:hypothetical protein